jgi:K319-like protein/photosystem II reaction center protein PsbP
MKKFLIILKGLLTGDISIGITPRSKYVLEMDKRIPTSYQKISDRLINEVNCTFMNDALNLIFALVLASVLVVGIIAVAMPSDVNAAPLTNETTTAPKEALNKPPIANAGTDQIVNESTIVILDGKRSSDPDLDKFSYDWSQITGPQVNLSRIKSANPVFAAPSGITNTVPLSFVLVVNDGKEDSKPDSVTITVNPKVLTEATVTTNVTTPGPSISPNFLTYGNPDAGFKISYPPNWEKDVNGKAKLVQFFAPSRGLSVSGDLLPYLTVYHGLDTLGRGLEVIAKDQIDEDKSGVKNFVLLDSVPLGRDSHKILYSFDDEKYGPTKSMDILKLFGDKWYVLNYQANINDFDQILPTIQQMIDSFELVSNEGPSLNKNENTTEVDTSESGGLSSVDNNSNTSFLSYENSKNGIKVQYPSSWTLQDDQTNSEDGILRTNIFAPKTSNGLSYVVIGYDPTNGKNISLEKYVDDSVKADKKEGIFNVESVKTDAMLGGRQAYSITLTNTADSTNRKSIEVGTLIGNKHYYILFDAEKPDYNTLLPDVQKMIDSFEIADSKGEINKQVSVDNANSNLTTSSNENSTSSPPGSISMKLKLNSIIDGNGYELVGDEISSTNAKICPTNNCQFSLLGRTGSSSSGGPAALLSKSDESGYTSEATLHVTDNDAQGNSIGSRLYDINMDFNKAGSEKKGDVTTENIKGIMTLTDESNSQAKTEYGVDGILQIKPDKMTFDMMEPGAVTLDLTAQEK